MRWQLPKWLNISRPRTSVTEGNARPDEQPTALSIGLLGEKTARVYLEEQGWRFIASNWRCKLGEIDLIMDDPSDNTRVFIEVKTRRQTQFGDGADVIATGKKQKLIRAAKYYQQEQGFWGNVRFDAIIISTQAGYKNKIEHIEHAFDAS